MSQNEVISQLEEFGLSPLEAKIYIFLLHQKPLSVLEISRALRVPRTNVYDNSLRLIEKGLVERVIEHKTQKLKTHPLDILQSIIDKKRQKLELLEKSLPILQEQFKIAIDPQVMTQVRYYQGVEGFKQMMWNALSAKNEHIGYSELGRVDVVGTDFLGRWMEQMIERQIVDRVIINPSKKSLSHLSDQEPNVYRKQFQKTRSIGEKLLTISGDTTIYNNVFAVTYWKHGEVVGVEIENSQLVKTQKAIFEILWNMAEPVKKDSK